MRVASNENPVSLSASRVFALDGLSDSMPTTSPFDPCTCSLCELTQHVRDTHHAYLKTELPLIWDLLRKAAATGRPAAAEVRAFAAVFGRFRSELENHLRKEEEVLFPMIERLDHAVRSGDRPPR